MLNHLAYTLKPRELNKCKEQSYDQNKSCQWLTSVCIIQLAQRWGLFLGTAIKTHRRKNTEPLISKKNFFNVLLYNTSFSH